ncbi:MAG: leucine-rich repeat protein, partial [Bacilli bacterium]
MEGEFIEGEPNPNLTIFVPEDSLDAYLNAEGWRNLLDRGITIVGSSEIAEIPDMNDFNEKFIINDGLVYILNYKKAGITTYNEDDFQISSTGVLLSYTGPGGDIIIPSSVTSINQNVFYDNHSITSVTIQEGCVSIGRQAFRGCINLKSVTCRAH